MRTSEGSTKHEKEKPVPTIAKMYQMVKTDDAVNKLNQLMGRTNSQ